MNEVINSAIFGVLIAAGVFLHWSASRVFRYDETVWSVVALAGFASLCFGFAAFGLMAVLYGAF